MKKRIVFGAAMLLTLGTAVAGTLMYGERTATIEAPVVAAQPDVTPEMLAAWRAEASFSDYVVLKAPI